MNDNDIIATQIWGNSKNRSEMAMKNKEFLADARLVNPSARSSINEDRVIADCKHTHYGEGDLLLDIIKEGLMVKHLDSYRRTRPTVDGVSTTNG